MKQTINKIQKLSNIESFLQIHFIKGYKYVDKAGEIVNYFYKGNKEPIFSMTMNGLDIFNPEEKIDSIKISPKSFWAHFLQPDSLEQMDSFFGAKAQDILKILEVSEISRIGWRSYLVHEFNNEEDRKKVLQKFVPIDNSDFEETSLTYLCKKVNLTIRLRKIVKNDDAALPSLLFDIDFYQKYEEPLGVDSIVLKLGEFKDVIKSDDVLLLINKILEENGKI